MGSKGTNTTTTEQLPPGYVSDAYRNVIGGASDLAKRQYQGYGGQWVADLNQDQQGAFQTVRNAQGAAQPYINQAAMYANQGAAPVSSISSADISAYYNPYQQQVINATMGNINETNAQQQQQVRGNSAMQGALGGDRVKVAGAELARQQGLASNQTLANLQSRGFDTALGAAQSQQANQQTNAQRAAQAAYSFGNLGQQALGTQLQGAQAQLQTGGLQQQNQQANLTAQQQEHFRKQAYDFQVQQWLAGITGSIGSQAGGTSSTTGPAPNPWGQVAGLGLTALGAYTGAGGKFGMAADGGRIVGYDEGGGVPMTLAGVPYADAVGYVPQMQLSHGSGPPKPPSVDHGTGSKASSMMQDATAIGKGLRSSMTPPTNINPMTTGYTPPSVGDIMPPSIPTTGLYAQGGLVPRGYDDGGEVTPSFDERFFGSVPEPEYAPAVASPPRTGSITGGLGYDIMWPGAEPVGAKPVQTLSYARQGDIPEQMPVGDDGSLPVGGAAAGLPRPRMGQDETTGSAGPRSPANIPPPSLADQAPNALNPNGGVAQTEPEGKRGFDMSHLGGPMMAAGLTMLASRSPNLGNAIGEGGLAGVRQYGLQKKEALDERKVASDEVVKRSHAKYYMDMAKNAQGRLALDTQTRGDNLADKKQARADMLADKEDARVLADQTRRDALAKGAVPARGKNANGEDVDGYLQFDPETRKYQFHENAVPTPKGGVKGPADSSKERLIKKVQEDHARDNPDAPPLTTAQANQLLLKQQEKRNKFQDANDQQDAKRLKEYTDTGNAALSGIKALDEIDSMRAEAYTGPVLGAAAAYVHGPTMALAARAGQLALNFGQQMKGSLSDKDREFIMSLVPGTALTGEAGQKVSDLMRAGFERQRQMGLFYRQWAEKYNSLKGADDAWNRYVTENEITVKDTSPENMKGLKYNPNYNRDFSTYLEPAKAAHNTVVPATPAQPPSVPGGASYSPSRNQWRTPDGTVYDADGNKVNKP